MKLYNPFKRIKQLETQIDVLEGILEDKYRLIENYITLVEKLENSLNEHGIKTEISMTCPGWIQTMKSDGTIIRGENGKDNEIVIEIDTTEHDRKVLEDSKYE